MYEHYRNNLINELSKNFSPTDINKIINVVDSVSNNYEFSEKCTELAIVEEFPKLVTIYLYSKKLEGCSDNTIKLYRNRLRLFFEHVRKDPTQVTSNEVRMFLSMYQTKTGLSDCALDKFRTIINGFYEWLVCEEYVLKNPCKVIKPIKFIQKERNALTRIQLEKLRRVAANKDPRALAIVDTLYSTACRVSELINIKLSDINTEKYYASIIGKGNKPNIVYFNEKSRLSIDDYLSKRSGNSEYLFSSPYAPYNKMSISSVERLIASLGKEIGVHITPHILRHTSATLALESGMNITEIQKMLGHSKVSTTQIYAKTSQESVRYAHLKYVI